MNVEHKDFIAIYKDVYPEGYCEHLISEFERLVQCGSGYTRIQSENAARHRKNDLQLGLNMKNHSVTPFNNTNVVDMFFEGLQRCYLEYTERYSVLADNKVRATYVKMQRTDPGGGYHIWHCEQGSDVNANRVLVYMLYLNTLQPEEAGETEFLYQQTRLRPTANTMIVWPAAYTHAHRGNVVHGNNSKYIVTGWFYYE